MKTKALILIAAAAAITLSFTFVSVANNGKTKSETRKESFNEPVGGFVSEDKI